MITAPSDVVAWLRSLLVATDAVFYKRGGRLVRDEKKRKFIEKTDTGGICLAGFLEKICGFLDGEDIEYRIIQKLPVHHNYPELPGIELYDFQRTAVFRLFQLRRGYLELPTGAGKSEVVLAALRACTTPFRAVILVRSIRLLDSDPKSWIPRAKNYGLELGKIHQDVNFQKNITVCSIPTLFSRLDFYTDFLKKQDFVFVDEAHEALEQAEKVLAKCTNAHVRIGLTATPKGESNTANMLLEGLYGPCLMKRSQKQVHDMGHAPSVEVHTHTINTEEALAHTRSPRVHANPLRAREWLTGNDNHRYVYEVLVYNNNTYELKIKEIIEETKRKKENVLIFVDYYTHARELGNSLKIPYAYSEGKSVFSKNKWIHDSDNTIDFSKSNVWIVTTFLTTGFDYSEIHNIILAGGMKSHQRLIQRIGRGMRKREKMILRIHDLKFTSFKHNGKSVQVPFLSKHFNSRNAEIRKALPHAIHYDSK